MHTALQVLHMIFLICCEHELSCLCFFILSVLNFLLHLPHFTSCAWLILVPMHTLRWLIRLDLLSNVSSHMGHFLGWCFALMWFSKSLSFTNLLSQGKQIGPDPSLFIWTLPASLWTSMTSGVSFSWSSLISLFLASTTCLSLWTSFFLFFCNRVIFLSLKVLLQSIYFLFFHLYIFGQTIFNLPCALQFML